MELKLVKDCSYLEVHTIHNGKTYRWEVLSNVFDAALGNDTNKKPFDVFKYINRWWAEETPPKVQDQIFDVYGRIQRLFERFLPQYQLTMALRPLVAELFELHPQTALQNWVWSTAVDILIPPSIKKRFDPTKDKGQEERTIVEADYQKLIPLTISMRIMIPVWGKFIALQKRDMGTTFKEINAYKLLVDSNVMHCEAMVRLRTFVDYTVRNDVKNDAAIIQGIGSEDFPDWIMGNTVVRRLGYDDTGVIDTSPEQKQSLVTFLYNFIVSKAKSPANQMGGIKDKDSDRGGGIDGDNNHSKLEGFKITSPVSTGDIALISWFIERSIRITKQTNRAIVASAVQNWRDYLLKPTYRTEIWEQFKQRNALAERMAPKDHARLQVLIRQSHQTITKAIASGQLSLTPAQVTVTGWVMSPWVSIRTIPYLSQQDVLGLMAHAQAYLWQNDHLELALMLTARSELIAIDDVMLVSDARQKLPKAIQEDIVKSYPYPRRTNSRAKQARMLVATLDALEATTERFLRYNWWSNLPVGKMWEVEELFAAGQRYIPPSNLRELLGKLILEIDQKYGEINTTMDIKHMAHHLYQHGLNAMPESLQAEFNQPLGQPNTTEV